MKYEIFKKRKKIISSFSYSSQCKIYSTKNAKFLQSLILDFCYNILDFSEHVLWRKKPPLFFLSNFRPVNMNYFYLCLSLPFTFQEPGTSNARVPPVSEFSGALSSPLFISLWLCTFIHRWNEPFDDWIPSPIVLSLCVSKDRKPQRCYPRVYSELMESPGQLLYAPHSSLRLHFLIIWILILSLTLCMICC